jgi:hypothetical protein
MHDADPLLYFGSAADAMQRMQPRGFVCERALQWRLLEAQVHFAWQIKEYDSACDYLKRAIDAVFSKEPRREMEAEGLELQEQMHELARQMQDKKMGGIALKLYKMVRKHMALLKLPAIGRRFEVWCAQRR